MKTANLGQQMEVEQIKSIIEIYNNNIGSNKFDNILLGAFSGNQRIKNFVLADYYKFCLPHPCFNDISEVQLDIVLKYLIKFYKDIITYKEAYKKYYITVLFDNMNDKFNSEKAILRVLEVYNQK